MKCLRAHFDTESNPFGDLYDVFVTDGEWPRGELRDIRLRRDGTLVELCHLETAPDPARVAAKDDIVDFDISPTADGGAVCHLHMHPTEEVRRLLELLDEYDLLLDTPIRLTREGVTVHVLGSHSQLTAAVSSLPDPISAAFSVDGLSEYTPVTDSVRAGLTTRQREALSVAVELGYYDVPRDATIDDVADELDCSPSTASEHLRKAESHVLTKLG
ncbi:helix-turn-helix domain-containing protein [Haloferax namakaokahaiae]|uniref:Helix-turn-helix domain-containing protein n=1 Tax=Haloferax namakaokahaiae TaxID=1748331 RepID=A0ABD5ZIT6_9EURY